VSTTARHSTLSAKRDNAVGKHWRLAASSEKAFPPTASADLLTYQSLGSIMKQLGGQKDLWAAPCTAMTHASATES
jgi:hypothetical protein